MLENLRNELVGKELNCIELDNIMESYNCYSEMDAYDEGLLESGVILYALTDDDEEFDNCERHYHIEFEVAILANLKEEHIGASCLKIKDISFF